MQTVKAAEASREVILAIETANVTEARIYEQQALRRLAELGAPPVYPPAPPNEAEAPATGSAGGVGATLAGAFKRMVSLFSPVDLVQQVGPGIRPLARQEWERSKWSTPPRPGIY